MTTNQPRPTSRKRAGAVFGRMLVFATILASAGCSDLLNVDNPTNLLDEDLTNPQLEETLSGTAEGNLIGPISFAMRYGTLLTDHYWHPSLTLQGINLDHGYRDRANDLIESMFNGLASGTWIADDMVVRLGEMVDNAASNRGVADSYYYGAEGRMALAGYFRQVVFDGGQPQEPAVALAEAADRFQMAAQIYGALGDANERAGALNGAARAYRSLYYEPISLGSGSGDPSNMAAAEQQALQALDIDPDFYVEAEYGAPGPSNQMAAHGRERMTPWFANRRDPVTGEIDPRITHDELSITPDGEYLYRDQKYPDSPNTPLPMNRAAEAELIVAEARLIANDLGGAVQYINRVRARSGLTPFDSNDADEIWAQLHYERDTELWLEGRRWEDMRYYNIVPECPGPWTAPTIEDCGASRLWDDVNKQIGMALRLPVSVQESGNNPNFGGS